MKKFKRILSVFLALMTVFSVLSVGVVTFNVSAESNRQRSNGVFEYLVLSSDSARLRRVVDMDYTGKTLVIPAEIDGHKVVGIDGSAESFYEYLIESGNVDTITSIKIEEGIVQLDPYGLYNDPDSYYEDYYEDMEFEDFNEQGIFSGLKNLKNVSLPKSLKALDDGMFSNCTSLRKVTLPDTVEFFGYNVFGGCTSLKYVNLPSNMKNIPANMFKNCRSLESINLPSSLESIDDSAFAYCESLKGQLKLPKSLKAIGEKAFYGCKSLTGKLEIPKNLKKIRSGAFAFCTGLTSFRIADGNKYFSQKGGVLFNKKKTKIHCYLSGKETKEYNIPSTVKSVDEYAFAGTKYLRKITLSKKMRWVGEYAFYKSRVKEVNLPKSIDSISEGAFKNCKNIKSIKLPANIIQIGDSAFENCKNLKEIKIPSKVVTIGNFAFKGCSSLKSLTFPKSVSTIFVGAFDNCKNLKSVKILNKKCDIYFWKDKVSGCKPTIYGYKNSTAQKFAKTAKLKFVTVK